MSNPSVAAPATAASARVPYATCLCVGLGGLFAGVTGPLLSTFVPPLVQRTLGDHRTAIGFVMAIDNVLLLLLVPWAGAASDRAAASGRGRVPMIVGALVLSAIGMALFPWSGRFGIAGVIAAIVVLYSGINVQRSPFQAVIADAVPSRFRSLATGSVTFQMCVGAIVFLMLGRMLGMERAFLIAAATVLVIAAGIGLGLKEPPPHGSAVEASVRSLIEAGRTALGGTVPGMRAIFIATLFLQLTFQTFTTWFALHGTERFGVKPEDVTIGFIAWAVGGVIGAIPAGFIGLKFGRRNAMLAGFALMAACLLALDRVAGVSQATPLLALASAAWTLPMVNAYPMFVEPIPRERRGVLTALFLLCMALGGGVGDPMNGALFDAFGSYRPMFLMMATYTALAFVAVLAIPRGTGEARPVSD
ncbi:MAG TPA: MFS transporter [Gemmatimonadaceae bacterium]|nr:MFS transporter [Gemmatimonadaceae bacterium]